MDITLKQKFRQPFGYYMENLIGKHFSSKGIFVMHHEHSHAYEWGMYLGDNDLIQLKKLLEIVGVDIEESKKKILKIINQEIIINDINSTKLILNLFNIKDDSALFQRKLILYEISRLVGSNKIEFIRIENNKLIVSEIKSQYGPNPDFRIEFEYPQVKTFTKLTNGGIHTSIIYCIALPEPRFVEIPFSLLYEKFNEYNDFNGQEFTGIDKSRIRIRIPMEYRKESNFIKIDKSLYKYVDLPSLLNSILNEFPNKFNRLSGLL